MTRAPLSLTLTLSRPGPRPDPEPTADSAEEDEVVRVALDLAYGNPENAGELAPVRVEVALNLTELLALQRLTLEYGKALARQLFAAEEARTSLRDAENAARETDRALRVSLCIHPELAELQALRWELLRHPTEHTLLATSARIWFSRFLLTRDRSLVHVRARGELNAVVAVAAPPVEALAKYNLAAVDAAGELDRASAALGALPVTRIGGPGCPCTLKALVEAADDADIVTLVCHGGYRRGQEQATLLYLQDEAGGLKVHDGEELVRRLRELPRGPRLVVLASCQSAGDGAQERPGGPPSAEATLAAQLGAAGVPAVLAMQGLITQETVAQWMPVFWAELLQDGQIDRAIAAARRAVQERPDAWMPALFLRLRSGRIWYTPGFGTDNDGDIWRRLLRPVLKRAIVPILGPGLLEQLCGTPALVARNLAEKNGFPLAIHEWDDLPRVAQFLGSWHSRSDVLEAWQDELLATTKALHRGRLRPEEEREQAFLPLLRRVGARARQERPDEPFRLLAKLEASVYLTTTPDPLLEDALREAGVSPQRAQTRWRYDDAPAAEEELSHPTKEAPLVFHALGALPGEDDEELDGLVLTEDDYFNYLIATSADRLMPDVVAGALMQNSLLFLGFRLTDWSFRVLFRLIVNLGGSKLLARKNHVAVQVDPDLQGSANVERAKRYLQKYFGETRIDLYWGTPQEFLAQLDHERRRLQPEGAATSGFGEAR